MNVVAFAVTGMLMVTIASMAIILGSGGRDGCGGGIGGSMRGGTRDRIALFDIVPRSAFEIRVTIHTHV